MTNRIKNFFKVRQKILEQDKMLEGGETIRLDDCEDEQLISADFNTNINESLDHQSTIDQETHETETDQKENEPPKPS